MAQPFEPTPMGRRLIGLLRQAVATDNGDGIAAISYRLPIVLPGSNVPRIFTVDLAPDAQGAFRVTCREIPDLGTCGHDEEEALEMVEASIRQALDPNYGPSE